MIISQHSGNNIAHQSGSWEPQRTSNFAIVIAGLPDTERLVFCVKSLSFPGPTVTKQSIKFFNDSVHYAGAADPVEDAVISFRDYLDIDTVGSLAKWFKQVYNPETGAIGFASAYKKTAEVFLLPPDMPNGAGVPAAAYRNRIWNLSGVWPRILKYPDLDHDSAGENAIVQLTLAVDRAIPAQMGKV